MSNLERWSEQGRRDDEGSGGEEEADEVPAFLRPTAQTARRTEAARAELMMVEQHEARQRDQGIEKASVVDQSQFRNTQIGEGYLHRTVVRQPTARDISAEEGGGGPSSFVDRTPAAVMERKERKRQRKERESAHARDYEVALAEARRTLKDGHSGAAAEDSSSGPAGKRRKKDKKKEKKEKKKDKKKDKKKKGRKEKKEAAAEKGRKTSKHGGDGGSSSDDSSEDSSDEGGQGKTGGGRRTAAPVAPAAGVHAAVGSCGTVASIRGGGGWRVGTGPLPSSSDEDDDGPLPGPSLPRPASPVAASAAAAACDPVKALEALAQLRKLLIKAIGRQQQNMPAL